tara:strand:- start:324 stop:485 length:162 start_codon:yes stop_codon:yes gene_type:complete
MIKWIKNIFCKMFGIKQCKCSDSEVIIIKEKPEHCDGHRRYRNNCEDCRKVVA